MRAPPAALPCCRIGVAVLPALKLRFRQLSPHHAVPVSSNPWRCGGLHHAVVDELVEVAHQRRPLHADPTGKIRSGVLLRVAQDLEQAAVPDDCFGWKSECPAGDGVR